MIDLQALGTYLYGIAFQPFLVAGGIVAVITLVVNLFGFIYRLKTHL
jgi:hypothetical protein